MAPNDTWSCVNGEFECSSIVGAWAVGGKAVVLPQQAGFPLNAIYKYVVMQASVDFWALVLYAAVNSAVDMQLGIVYRPSRLFNSVLF